MEALRDDNVNFIGIHGIAGVGKITMVKYVGKKVKEDKLFDEVVMAVVSQNKDIGKIQSEIAGWLGFVLTDDQIMLRATKLCDRIKQVRRILVILDDVWDNLDLVAVGIPSNNDHRGCKIIITTRREQVYRSMGMVGRRKNIALNVLSEEDSWHLFRSKAGIVDFPKLNAIAREVWRECGNLPLALVMVGSAMSGKQDTDDWKEAAQQLKNSSQDDIDGVEEQVYRSIKLSFDYLKDQSAQNLILLCTLFPEDHNICIEDMVRYGWGLRMLRGSVDTVQGARRRTKTMINNLKEASLLLPSDREGYIKMHDLVRDVAISIRWDKYIRSDNWPIEGISLMGDTSGNYSSVKDFANTKILLLMGNEIESWSCSHHLSKLKELNVVYVNNRIGQGYFAGGRTVLGSGSYAFFHQQTCLRTLVLRNIDGPDIGAIGKIITLEILDLRGCRFHEAPDASFIRGLTNLRVLDLRDTTGQVCSLEDGADSGMVSPHLTRLEELYLGDGILLSWDDMNILRELPRLKVLVAHLANIQTMPRDFVFPHQLDLLRITLGFSRSLLAWDNHTTPSLQLEDMVKETADLWRGSLKALLTNCVGSLTIHHCGKVVSVFPDLTDKTDDLKLLTDLSISFCEGFRYIIDTGDDVWDEAQQMLSSLEYLKLSHLRRLECLFKLSSTATPQVVYLCNLKRVEMGHCDSLRYLFQTEIAHSLAQLEELRLWYCLKLEEIVADDQGDTDEEKRIILVFPNLKHVSLKGLPNLRGFCCRGDLLFDCPSLEQLHVFHCPKMTSFAANQSSTPKLKSIQFHEGLEMIPQGMDLNQFLLQNHHHRQERRKHQHPTLSKG